MRKKWLCCFCCIVLLFLLFIILYKYQTKQEMQAPEIPEETGTMEIYFCPRDNCEEKLLQKMNTAQKSIHCAFYNLNLPVVIQLLQKKEAQGLDVKVVGDNDNAENLNLAFLKTDTRPAYMHNKFCILDNKEIMTGSMNPTGADTAENNNNILFISSATLAQNYEEEFSSFWEGNFGEDAKVLYPKLLFNNFTIENYFCPEDSCEAHIAETLKQANESIVFMQFSFTSDVLGDILLEKSKNVSVVGIFEKQQKSAYSEYEKLQQLNVSWDSNSGLLHHKVFIIDDKIVITGSMNPSRNGNEKNDENILIIHSSEIAILYGEEFERISKE